jgi:hypothetical protein
MTTQYGSRDSVSLRVDVEKSRSRSPFVREHARLHMRPLLIMLARLAAVAALLLAGQLIVQHALLGPLQVQQSSVTQPATPR